MKTFSALLANCAGNSPVTDEFPAQKLVPRSFDVFFDLCLNKRLSKQSWGWWFGTPSRPLRRHCNAWKTWDEWPVGNHNKTEQSANFVHNSLVVLYFYHCRLVNQLYHLYIMNELCRILRHASMQLVANRLFVNKPTLIQLVARRWTGDKPILCISTSNAPVDWLIYELIWVTRPRWVNSYLLQWNLSVTATSIMKFIYSVTCLNDDRRYQFTRVNNFCLLKLI